ncbi:hypothetical protein L0337_05645 [candidate division KSB1 bacterium]|nr:hypothetical protein [candidate division KSB1 bacterium]
MKDRHERRKDREWREKEERQKMRLENLQLETRILTEQVELLKSLGCSEQQIRRFLSKHYYEPLAKLDKYQDDELIGSADVVKVEVLNMTERKIQGN